MKLLNIFDIPQASNFAPNVDLLFSFVLWLSVISFIGVVAGFIYFITKFNRKKVDENKTPFIEGHTGFEVAVSFLLLVWVMAIFAWGWIDYKKMLASPAGAIEINVLAKQWSWEFEYTNGRKSSVLLVPLNKPVKLIMTSRDVLHSFYVPNFRVKQDIIPKRYTTVWFTATQAGEHNLFCTEYCGTAHSGMITKAHVVSEEEYNKTMSIWEFEQRTGQKLAGTSSAQVAQKPEELGKELFAKRACITCHSTTKAPLVGPGLAGLFGREVEFDDNTKAVADENYIRESLMEPTAKVVKGFPKGVMPTFQGQLTDEELNALLAYLKSLK